MGPLPPHRALIVHSLWCGYSTPQAPHLPSLLITALPEERLPAEDPGSDANPLLLSLLPALPSVASMSFVTAGTIESGCTGNSAEARSSRGLWQQAGMAGLKVIEFASAV